MRQAVVTSVKAFLLGLLPILWVAGALYLDRFQFETNYRAGLLILYMLAIFSWGVVGGLANTRDKQLMFLIRNAASIACISFSAFFVIYGSDAYVDSLYYKPGDEWVTRLPGSIRVGFQLSMLFVGVPFLLGYIPGKLVMVIYRRMFDQKGGK